MFWNKEVASKKIRIKMNMIVHAVQSILRNIYCSIFVGVNDVRVQCLEIAPRT